MHLFVEFGGVKVAYGILVTWDSVKSQILVIMYMFKCRPKDQLKNIADFFFFNKCDCIKWIYTLMMSWLKLECRVDLIGKHYKQVRNVSNLRTLI